MLFTYNPAFKSPAAKSFFTKYGIDPRRVVVIDQPRGGKRVYATESADMVSAFFKLHTVNKSDHILSDGGNSFTVKKVDIFADLGYKQHAVYPAPVHQYLSPNDNRLHGVAKRRWRAAKIDYANDVESSLHLLWELGRVQGAQIRKWFNINLQLDQDEATAACVEASLDFPGTKTTAQIGTSSAGLSMKSWSGDLLVVRDMQLPSLPPWIQRLMARTGPNSANEF